MQNSFVEFEMIWDADLFIALSSWNATNLKLIGKWNLVKSRLSFFSNMSLIPTTVPVTVWSCQARSQSKMQSHCRILPTGYCYNSDMQPSIAPFLLLLLWACGPNLWCKVTLWEKDWNLGSVERRMDGRRRRSADRVGHFSFGILDQSTFSKIKHSIGLDNRYLDILKVIWEKIPKTLVLTLGVDILTFSSSSYTEEDAAEGRGSCWNYNVFYFCS